MTPWPTRCGRTPGATGLIDRESPAASREGRETCAHHCRAGFRDLGIVYLTGISSKPVTVAVPPSHGSKPEAVSSELLHRCDENFIEAFRSVARSLPKSHIREHRGIVMIASGIPGPEFNPVFITEPPPDPDSVLATSASFMSDAGIPSWRAVVFSACKSTMEPAAHSAGLRPGAELPGMILDPIPPRRAPLPLGFKVRPVKDRSLWATMVTVGMRGFGGAAPRDPEDLLPFTEGKGWRGYVGFAGKTPVATSIGFTHLGIGGVYFVATLPEFRGKGYGRALTEWAAVDARREGCRTSCLQSSAMGYKVYAGMGYRTITSYSQWMAGSQ